MLTSNNTRAGKPYRPRSAGTVVLRCASRASSTLFDTGDDRPIQGAPAGLALIFS